MNKKDNGDMNLISLRDSGEGNFISQIFIDINDKRKLDEAFHRERFYERYPEFNKEEVAKLDYRELVIVMNRLD